MELCRRVEGCDRGDLLCVEASRRTAAFATGSEARSCAHAPRLRSAEPRRAQEGTVCVFDARSFDVMARLRDAGGAGDAVTSLAFHPGAPLASLACAQQRAAACTRLTRRRTPVSHPAAHEHALYAACGAAVLELDLRQARAWRPPARTRCVAASSAR